MVAAAIWYPYLAEPRERVVAWGADSYRVFADLAGEEGAGVRMLPGTEVLPERTGRPVVGLGGAGPGARRSARGVRRRVVVHRPGRRHAGLPALAARRGWRRLGGTLTRISLGALPRPPTPTTSSSTARGWARACWPGTPRRSPVRGQVVLVEGVDARPVVARLDRADVRRAAVAPGRGRRHRAAGDWSRTPSPETATDILRAGHPAGPRAGGRPGRGPPRRAQTGACRRTARGGGADGALLRPGWRRRDAQLGMCRRGGRRWSRGSTDARCPRRGRERTHTRSTPAAWQDAPHGT